MGMSKHHEAWLSNHPDRGADWFTSIIGMGFHVHHVDGNHENNELNNLILVEAKDHMRIHGADLRQDAAVGVEERRQRRRADKIADNKIAKDNMPTVDAAIVAELVLKGLAGDEFGKWMEYMGYGVLDAARALDKKPSVIERYLLSGCSHCVRLACVTLRVRLAPYKWEWENGFGGDGNGKAKV